MYFSPFAECSRKFHLGSFLLFQICSCLIVTALSVQFHPYPEGDKRTGRERTRTPENQDSSNQAIPLQTFVIFNKNSPPCEDNTEIIHCCNKLKTDCKKKKKLNPFALGDFAEKSLLKLVERFSGHCRAIKS